MGRGRQASVSCPKQSDSVDTVTRTVTDTRLRLKHVTRSRHCTLGLILPDSEPRLSHRPKACHTSLNSRFVQKRSTKCAEYTPAQCVMAYFAIYMLSPPKQMTLPKLTTDPRVPLMRSDCRAQWQNPGFGLCWSAPTVKLLK